jgi:hypothetical protein
MFGHISAGFRITPFALVSLLAPCGGLLGAEQAVPFSNSREHADVAFGYLNERLAVWQQRLNLQDWKISVIMTRESELKPKTLGNIHWESDKKTAVIRVLDASDYKLPFRDMLDDMEFTVVHELIHLELSSLPRSAASRREEEHAVNQITDALLNLDRRQ